MNDSKLLNLLEELKVIISDADSELRKNVINKNKSAGLRARKHLRLLKTKTHELLMASIDADKG